MGLTQSMNNGYESNPVGPVGPGTGDVVGPASSTDNAIVRWDGNTGKLIQNSVNLIDDSGNTSINQLPSAGGAPVALQVNAAAHTTLAPSTEVIDVQLNLGRIVEHSAGNYFIQRAVSIQRPTYSFTGPSALDNAGTVVIDGPPEQGSNASINEAFGLAVGASTSAASSAFAGLFTWQGISAGTGNAGIRSALFIPPNPVDLGDQNATVDTFAGILLVGATPTSSVASRTVNIAASLLITNPPVAGGNVIFSGLPYSIFSQNGLVRFDGTIWSNGIDGPVPTAGDGTRFMWIPSKAALRAGHATGGEWDAANIGQNSTALGLTVSVSGQSSFAAGEQLTVGGQFTLAAGFNNITVGDSNAVFGQNNSIDGIACLVSGNSNTITGNVNYAFGSVISIVGNGCLSIGGSNTITGTSNFVLAVSSTVDGIQNSAFGANHNVTAGNQTAVFGFQHTVTGSGNAVFGFINSVSGTNSCVVGSNDSVNGDSNAIFGNNHVITGAVNSAVGTNQTITGDSNFCAGVANVIQGTSSFCFGQQNNITANSSYGFGENLTISSTSVFAVNVDSGTPVTVSLPKLFSFLGGQFCINSAVPFGRAYIFDASDLECLFLENHSDTVATSIILNHGRKNNNPLVNADLSSDIVSRGTLTGGTADLSNIQTVYTGDSTTQSAKIEFKTAQGAAPVLAQTISENGDVIAENFTQLGSGNPLIKVTTVSGVTDIVVGGFTVVNLPADVIDANIISVSVLVEYAANAFIGNAFEAGAGFRFDFYTISGSPAQLVVQLDPTNSGAILGLNFRAVITYIK
jgi:hypothetical protein